jgi:hypothetical protein
VYGGRGVSENFNHVLRLGDGIVVVGCSTVVFGPLGLEHLRPTRAPPRAAVKLGSSKMAAVAAADVIP